MNNDRNVTDLKHTYRDRTGHSRDSGTVDRLPPHDANAEMGVLGCILLNPTSCLGDCVQKFRAGSEVFYDLRHQTIYEALLKKYESREFTDLLTLRSTLKDSGRLEEIGGYDYLAKLVDGVPSAANLSYYLDIVLEKFTLRRIVQQCTEFVGRAYEHNGPVATLLDEVEHDILSIRQFRGNKTAVPMNELVSNAMQLIEEYATRSGQLLGLSTGLPDLDKISGGMMKGDMIVIAARPSMGKTTLAMQIAEHVSVEYNLPTAIFSMEMANTQLVMRALCSRARVNLRNVTEGFLAERDFPRLTNAAGKLHKAPLYIDDETGMSIGVLRAKARRMVQSLGIKLFVIDYLQLLQANVNKKRIENRQQEVSEISSGIKGLAKELNVPVIVLSQLNRQMELHKGRKPSLADLRESGAIEQDADFVGLLYQPAIDEEQTEVYGEATPTNLLIAKQRNGPLGEVNLTFLKSFTRFESAAKLSDDDVPNDQQPLPYKD